MTDARAQTLVIHPGALGDVLLAVPALRALRTVGHGPLGLLARAEIGRLLHACGEIDAWFPLEGPSLAELFAPRDSSLAAPTLNDRFQRWLEQSETAVCWLADPEGRLHQALMAQGIRRLIVQSPSAGEHAGHQMDRLLATIGSLVLPHHAVLASLRVPDEWIVQGRQAWQAAGGAVGPFVVLHPGSGSPHKCVEATVFGSLIRWCVRSGLRPCLLEGPADVEAVAAVRQHASVAIIRDVSLHAVAGLLAEATLFVGHDSGITHLAAWLGVPTVAMFGPTDPVRWQPIGPQVSVVHGAACRCEGWDRVRACREKPCLQLAAETVLRACEAMAARHCLVPPS